MYRTRVPPLQNPLWRAPQGGGTVSVRLTGLVPPDFAPQPSSDICRTEDSALLESRHIAETGSLCLRGCEALYSSTGADSLGS